MADLLACKNKTFIKKVRAIRCKTNIIVFNPYIGAAYHIRLPLYRNILIEVCTVFQNLYEILSDRISFSHSEVIASTITEMPNL